MMADVFITTSSFILDRDISMESLDDFVVKVSIFDNLALWGWLWAKGQIEHIFFNVFLVDFNTV